QDEGDGLDAARSQATAVLVVERCGVELEGIVLAQQVLIRPRSSHQAGVRCEDDAEARRQLHAPRPLSRSRRSRARRTSGCSVAEGMLASASGRENQRTASSASSRSAKRPPRYRIRKKRTRLKIRTGEPPSSRRAYQ